MTQRIKKPRGKTTRKTSAGETEPEKNDLLRMLHYMMLQKEAEQRIFSLFKEGKIVGGVFSGRGMEAIGVGSAYALDKNDIVVPLYRDLGAHLVRGMTLRQIFCQYLGRENGPTRGRDSTMRMGSPDNRIIAMSSHLGSMIPVAAGAALAGRVQGKNVCALTFIGDGGTSTGDFHEGLNMAAVLKLPLVLVVENNQYAYSTPADKQYACRDLVDRAAGYGIPGVLIDGNNIFDVYRTTRKAVLDAKKGKGPTLIEAKTFRMSLAGGTDHRAVSQKLLEEWKKKDPVENLVTALTEKKVITPAAVKEMQKKIESDIADAVTFAEKSPLPKSKNIHLSVYAE